MPAGVTISSHVLSCAERRCPHAYAAARRGGLISGSGSLQGLSLSQGGGLRGPLIRRAVICSAESQQAGLSLIEWDVVLYQPSSSCTALGRISELRAEAATIERLEEEGDGYWAVTECVDVVPLRCVSAVLEADYMQLCDADRVSNPHGEHAHEAFRINVPVPPGVWGAAARQK